MALLRNSWLPFLYWLYHMESIDGDRHSHFSLGEHHGPWPQIATELGSGVTFSIIHLTSNDPGFTKVHCPLVTSQNQVDYHCTSLKMMFKLKPFQKRIGTLQGTITCPLPFPAIFESMIFRTSHGRICLCPGGYDI